jgi:hypothetical protein
VLWCPHGSWRRRRRRRRRRRCHHHRFGNCGQERQRFGCAGGGERLGRRRGAGSFNRSGEGDEVSERGQLGDLLQLFVAEPARATERVRSLVLPPVSSSAVVSRAPLGPGRRASLGPAAHAGGGEGAGDAQRFAVLTEGPHEAGLTERVAAMPAIPLSILELVADAAILHANTSFPVLTRPLGEPS